MKYLFAPLEGITGYTFRNAHRRFFPGIDYYYAPFIVANQTMHFKRRELRDVSPENNTGVPLIPQVLTNRADQFLCAVKMLRSLGYDEINLNLGCPAATVVPKKKGAGFLSVLDELDRFFHDVFDMIEQDGGLRGRVSISVKTRPGMESLSESVRLMEIYNRYPLHGLIIHPRVGKDMYKGTPALDVFGEMFSSSRHPVCYNGDLKTPADIESVKNRFPGLEAVMIGRGLLRDPALVREANGGTPADADELHAYLAALTEGYRTQLYDEKNVLYKMKELWNFLAGSFPEHEKELKRIRKARTLAEYETAADIVLSSLRPR